MAALADGDTKPTRLGGANRLWAFCTGRSSRCGLTSQGAFSLLGSRSWPQAVTDLVPRCHFPEPKTPINCAVSGGPDSLALLVLALAAGCDVTAIHVDHGLRAGSASEAEDVAEVAKNLGARFRAERVDVEDGPNLEARARTARFSVLPDGTATGHTMDDQAETVLCNLLRGAGLDGMAGMEPGSRHPLLGLRRTETEAVCAAMGLHPFRDPSNLDRRHLRNRVRHELLPLCSELAQRDPVPVLARQADLNREEAWLLDEMAGEAVHDPADARALTAAPLPLARRALRIWLNGSSSDVPFDRHPPSAAEIARVLRVASGEALATEISGGRRVSRSEGQLRLEPPRAEPSSEP